MLGSHISYLYLYLYVHIHRMRRLSVLSILVVGRRGV